MTLLKKFITEYKTYQANKDMIIKLSHLIPDEINATLIRIEVNKTLVLKNNN